VNNVPNRWPEGVSEMKDSIKDAAVITEWHSTLGMDAMFLKDREIRIAATDETLREFVPVGQLLISRATKQLWKLADDGKTIVKLFDDADIPLSFDTESLAQSED